MAFEPSDLFYNYTLFSQIPQEPHEKSCTRKIYILLNKYILNGQIIFENAVAFFGKVSYNI